MAADLIYLAVATMLVPALAEIGKISAKTKKALEYIAAGGVLFLIGAAFEVANEAVNAQAYAGVFQGITLIAGIVGTIFVLVGGIMAVINLMK